jgi:hypothetical protein
MRNWITKTLFRAPVLLFLAAFFCNSSEAQYLINNDSAFLAKTPNSARIWGYVFGDYFYKAHADSLNRGGNNQYTNVKQSTNEFQFRRIYLGFDYNINKTFSTEFLLAAEDDFPTGDLLVNNKFVPYIKFANVRWHDFLFKGNDMIVGLQPTPAFPYMTEYLFNYSRPVERTITDIRRTPSFDFGIGLQGRFNSKNNSVSYGYNLLAANGTSDKPQNLTVPVYKWFYGDAFIGFLNHRLVFDLYADYQRQNWSAGALNKSARQMTKGAIVWTTPKLVVGVESYINGLQNAETGINGVIKDTLNGRAIGTSFYIQYAVSSMFKLFFRYDTYNPNTMYNNTQYTKYATLYTISTSYEPNNKERFLSAGFDFSPTRNIHFIPNVWYDKYIGQQANLVGKAANDYDLVYRLTFYFTFGKMFAYPTYSYYH